jgi:histidine ammonia-lyase
MIALHGSTLTCAQVAAISRHHAPVTLSATARARAESSWALVREVATRRSVYGRTTGVGANRSVEADPGDGHGLRLLRSHAGGAGAPVPRAHVRAMLTVRINQFAAGGAGVAPGLLDALIAMLNTDALPMVHTYGAIGTGDLTALAETALTLLGERAWDATLPADTLPATTQPADTQPASRPAVPFDPADALAFLSSNAATLGEAALGCDDLRALAAAGLVVAALSFLAVEGNAEAYATAVLDAYPHPGAVAAGESMRALLGPAPGRPARIQDPFGFRVIPQVHGPVLDAVTALDGVLSIQLNAATENPLVSLTARDVLHHGHFHTAYVALALDAARAALAQSAALVSARLAALVEPALSGLPAFLATGPAGSSGVMILEYTAASALAEVRAAAMPAAVGNAVLSRGVEENASFSTQSAWATTRIVTAYRIMLACELVAAVRALRMRGARPGSERLLAAFEEAAAVLDEDTADRDLAPDLERAGQLVMRLGGIL